MEESVQERTKTIAPIGIVTVTEEGNPPPRRAVRLIEVPHDPFMNSVAIFKFESSFKQSGQVSKKSETGFPKFVSRFIVFVCDFLGRLAGNEFLNFLHFAIEMDVQGQV